MLGFVGLGFSKSLKVLQVISHNCYRSFENGEKKYQRTEKQLAKDCGLVQEKYELKRTRKNIA